ncbi:MAG TPA: S9 family peptidase [Thermoanaerobaculia bacterium]|nr:S9 family peptidase [Thermoanaerobaculia bacterium]
MRRSDHSPLVPTFTLLLTMSIPMSPAIAVAEPPAATPEASVASSPPAPPQARRVPSERTLFGHTLKDDYAWLRERDNPATIAHLEAENRWTEAVMAPTAELRETLYREMVGRIKETDLSAPYRRKGYFYYSRTEQGRQYPIHCRKRGSLTAPEEVMLDVNVLAQGRGFTQLGEAEPSPDSRLLAYTVDFDGSEHYQLRIRDLATGKDLPDVIPEVSAGVSWATDNQNLFYVTLDAANRPFRAWRHRLGTPPSEDVEVYHEPDDAFFVRVSRTKDDRFLLVTADSSTTSEWRFLPADQPTSALQLFRARKSEVEYSVEHHGQHFYVLTNEGAKNGKLMRVADGDPAGSPWEEIVPAREEVRLEGIEVFARHLAFFERDGGLVSIRVRDLATGAEHTVAQPEASYALFPSRNLEFDTTLLRFHYTSLVTPMSVFDYDLERRERTLVKATEVLGGYDPEQYATERREAKAPDGVAVPISLVYKKGLIKNGKNPCVLNGYGAYGASSDPFFSTARLSLLDRGFVFAIAHVRGGGDLGKRWHDAGKLQNKRNTFTDFIAVAEHLIREGYTSKERLAATGGSAGGLLIGAVVNARPDLFAAAIATVPFVDLMNTMLDPTLPLTVNEYEEWGNPNDQAAFETMLSYSPYDNVAAQEYPHLLVTAGLNDPRVSYWEPAKWVARLRATKKGDQRLLLRTDMGAGHGGASGRYDALKKVAFEYAFLIDVLGAR